MVLHHEQAVGQEREAGERAMTNKQRIKQYFKYVKVVPYNYYTRIADVFPSGVREWYEGMLRKRR